MTCQDIQSYFELPSQGDLTGFEMRYAVTQNLIFYSKIDTIWVVSLKINIIESFVLSVIHRDRMELEFQAKIKTYPFSHISGVKLDATKNRVLVSLTQGAQSNYTSSSHLQLSTADVTTATELHHRLQCIIESYPKGHKIS